MKKIAKQGAGRESLGQVSTLKPSEEEGMVSHTTGY
jgi:hypothetical protein